MLSYLKKSPFIIRMLHWEYWPTALVYGPIFPIYLWYCLKARSLFFFSTSNPTIKNAGLMMESKFGIDSIVPEALRPASIYFEPGTEAATISAKLEIAGFIYPLIIKPDIGSKGMGVKKISLAAELETVVASFPVPFIIQPFISYPKEIGLFYVKIPGQQRGRITGIVRKEFLQVTGDGEKTILQLLNDNPRYVLQLQTLKKHFDSDIHRIIAKGKTEILVPYGNHARGSLFLDESHRITQKLEAVFDEACSKIKGFYFGRMDIRFASWEALEQGKDFSIIELNGAGSEPTHIYDPKHSIFFAWKEIIEHWHLLWQVSKASKRTNRLPYMPFAEGIKMLRENRLYNRKCQGAF